jgi:hypothetical protein
MKANLETRSAPLSEEFGRDYATRLFGAEALADLPRYTRGPKKGQPKAWLRWYRATSGGWCRECQSALREGSMARAWICAGPFGLPSDALMGRWLGRVQNLCGSHQLLGEKNRAAEMARTA